MKNEIRATSAIFLAASFLIMYFGPFCAAAGASADAASIAEGSENYVVRAAGYTAVVDKPCGNLIALYNSEGYRMLGSDGGLVRGACAYWNDSLGATHVQMDDGNCPEVEIAYSGNELNVKCPAFEEQYVFLPDKVEIKMRITGSDIFLGDDFHLLVGSEKIVKNVLPNDKYYPPYESYAELKLDNYLTDFTTDISSGERSIISRHAINDKQFIPDQFYYLYFAGIGQEKYLEGRGTWYLRRGEVQFEKQGYYSSSPRNKDACFFGNYGDGNYTAIQSFDYFMNGDVAGISVCADSRGYTVADIEYPVPTNNGTNNGLCRARIVVPDYPAEGGYKLLMSNHGHTDNSWNGAYMWDFLGSEGYVIAATNYTSDEGMNHTRHDLGYNQQIEIESLRQWVMQNYEINPRRQYATGFSLGGLNTFLCAINHPDVYAAIIPESPIYDGMESSMILGTSTDAYTISVGDPRERAEQLICPIMVVEGTLALDLALVGTQLPLIMIDHPDARVFFSMLTGHDRRTWDSYRKEAFDFIEGNVLGDDERNSVNGRFYGPISGQVQDYVDNGMATYHNNSWISIGPFQNDTFTTVNASRVETDLAIKYTFKSDVQVQAAFAMPENGKAIEAAAAFDEKAITLDGRHLNAISFTAEAGKEYAIELAKGAESAETGESEKSVPGFEAPLVLICMLSISILFGSRKRW